MDKKIKRRIDMIKKNTVSCNYKKTKIGIIPKEWTECRIGDVTEFEGGSQPPKRYFSYKPKEEYIRLIQIRDYKSEDYKTYIPIKKTRKFCAEDDIMIGRYGPPIFQILRGLKGAYNVALIKAIPNEQMILKDYLYYYLQIDSLFMLIDKLSRRSSGQTGVDMDALNNFRLPLPDKDEQRNIINAISTWDKVIELKEELIRNKKQQKKALMKNLLTSKLRLNRFNQKWKTVKLGDVLKERTERGYENLELLSITSSEGVIKRSELDRKNTSSSNKSKYKRIKPLDIGYNTMRMWQGVCGVSEYEGIVSPAYTILKPTDKIDPYFMGYLFKLPEVINLFYRYSQGIVNDTLNLKYKHFKLIKVKIPADIEEQKEIAKILKTQDKEIELLKQEVEALKKQKKGLMQLLLTGKVRVNSESNS